MTLGTGLVAVEHINHVAVLTMNDPERRNPLSIEMGFALQNALHAAAADDDIRVIVLTGAGMAFSAGGDIRQFTDFANRAASDVYKEGEATTGLFKTITSLRKPVVGAINGHALGGGLGLAAACHYTVASQTAKFGSTEIKLGLFPLVILPILIANMGERRALEIGFTGEIFNAEAARNWGLVNEIVPQEDVLPRAVAFATQLAEASPLALRIGMDCFVGTRDLEWEKKLDFANALRVVSFLSEDLREGAQAFLDKRKPAWKGR
jgi:enoyl-CoA hydratase/carnithine racemase